MDTVTNVCPKCGGKTRKVRKLTVISVVTLILALLLLLLLSQKDRQPSRDPTLPIEQTLETEETIQPDETIQQESIEPEITVQETTYAEVTEPLEVQPDFVKAYLQIIQDLQAADQSPDFSKGRLYDMNDDGIPELVLTYVATAPEYVSAIEVCDLYTFRKGRVVKLMDQEPLSLHDVGGNVGGFAFIKLDGEKCFLISHMEWPAGFSGEAQEDDLGKESVKIYRLGDSDLECQTDFWVEYRYGDNWEMCGFQGSENGRGMSEMQYNIWCKRLTDVRWSYGMDGAYLPKLTELTSQLESGDWGGNPWGRATVTNPVKEARASSSYDREHATHIADNLLDDNLETNWAEGAKGDGTGQSVWFEFWDEYQLDEFRIWNGDFTSEEQYKEYGRPERIVLTFSDGSSQEFTIEDVMNGQKFVFETPVVTHSVEVTIASVYPGEKFKETTVISEINFMAYALE